MTTAVFCYLSLVIITTLSFTLATPIPPISPFTSSPFIPFNTDEFERPPHDCLVLARVFHKYDLFGKPYPVIWDSTPFCAEGHGARRSNDARPEYTWLAKEKDEVPEGRHWTFVAYGDLKVHEGDGWVARPGCVFESGKHGCLTESEWLPPRSEVVNPYLEPEGSPLYSLSRRVESPSSPHPKPQSRIPRIQNSKAA